MKRKLMLGAPLALTFIWACYEAPVEKPNPKVTQETNVRVEQNIKNKVDLLFVIDDSPSMAPKQMELRNRFPQLIKILDDFGKVNPAHYHIGVISTDTGSGPFTLGGGQCKPGGRGGKLQPIGAGAPTTCAGPTQGLNFINYNQLQKDGAGNPTSNLPAGQDLAATFACMSNVGDKGCGFEQPLDAVYRALHDMPAENHDFLRADALLFVVFVADEDDCSADPSSDIFDPAKVGTYGALLSYRCTQYGVACSNQLPPYGDSGGTLNNCVGATAAQGGKLTDVQKYINFFRNASAQGGVKIEPLDVNLTAITAESNMGISSLLANPNPTPPGPYVPCPGPVDGKNCAVVLQHSCISPQNTQFFGDPAVRINQVVRSLPGDQSLVTSICDTSYQAALEALGQKIVSSIGAGCITSPFEKPEDPDCIVEDVTRNADGSTTVKQLPFCGTGAAPPCWKLESKALDKCTPVCAKDGERGQHFGVTIDRGPGGMPPPATTARVACSTLAVPKTYDPVSQTEKLPVCGAPL
jgi:hypothetical protein